MSSSPPAHPHLPWTQIYRALDVHKQQLDPPPPPPSRPSIMSGEPKTVTVRIFPGSIIWNRPIVFHLKVHPSSSTSILPKHIPPFFHFHQLSSLYQRQINSEHLYPSVVLLRSEPKVVLWVDYVWEGFWIKTGYITLGLYCFHYKKQLCWQHSSTKYNKSFTLNYP